MNVLKEKLVVYDDNCPLCSRLRAQAVRLNILAEQECVAYSSLPREYTGAVDPDRFRDEIAIVDTGGGPTLYGSEGLLHIGSRRFPMFEPLFALPSFRSAAAWLYRIVAPNRYVVSTPPVSPGVCACAAAVPVRTRLRYSTAGLVVAVVITSAFAAAIPLPWIEGMLMTTAGWAAYGLIAAAVLRRRFIEFAAHMVSVMLRGVAVLVPAILAVALGLDDLAANVLLVVGAGMSFAVMLFQHGRRVRALCMSQWWTALWAVLLLAPWWEVFRVGFAVLSMVAMFLWYYFLIFIGFAVYMLGGL